MEDQAKQKYLMINQAFMINQASEMGKFHVKKEQW